jgi:hypothetical protein
MGRNYVDTLRNTKKYTADDLIEFLIKYRAEFGNWPRVKDIQELSCQKKGPSHHIFCTTLAGLKNAISRAEAKLNERKGE